MTKKKELKWYAFYQDFNSGKLVFTNVLGGDFIDDIRKRLKSKRKGWAITNYEELRDAINSYLMYRYWCRTEYEVIVKNWAGKDMEEKIDVYFQLKSNIDTITTYVINELGIKFKS